MTSRVDFGCFQNQGARQRQEDYFATSDPSPEVIASHQGFLMVVADGMGGHSDGSLASLTAVTTFLEEYGQKREAEGIPEALQRSLLQANQALLVAIRKMADESDMGTTLVAAVVQGGLLYWVSVGDSRLYRFRNGRLEMINEEHSFGAELDAQLAAGQISAGEAQAQANKRHMLTSYLGIPRIPKISLSRVPLDLRAGDQILLCTDGLNTLSEAEIQYCLGQPAAAQEKCDAMGQMVLDKRKRRQDNVTIVLLEAGPAALAAQSGQRSGLPLPPLWGWGGWAALSLLVVAAAAAAFFWWPRGAPSLKEAPARLAAGSDLKAAAGKTQPAPAPPAPKAQPQAADP
ncbi:MAG: protein phosphatase 2C domain-containing protein, partial [Thermodesulfobacteriota bacterium]